MVKIKAATFMNHLPTLDSPNSYASIAVLLEPGLCWSQSTRSSLTAWVRRRKTCSQRWPRSIEFRVAELACCLRKLVGGLLTVGLVDGTVTDWIRMQLTVMNKQIGSTTYTVTMVGRWCHVCSQHFPTYLVEDDRH